ncbi:MAG: TlyA family RNA methyltransferase [Pseudomonadota bacterium]
MRLDQLLVARGLSRTRSQAKEAILRGAVTVDGLVARRAGQNVSYQAEVVAEANPYVSRGGHKLSHALTSFGVEVAGKWALDVGASTGGFTDVLLRNNAAHVIALDVGHDQLEPTLRAHTRVTVIDGVNARGLKAGDLPFAPELVVFDVSFISLALVLPRVLALAADTCSLAGLVKPQFEVGRDGLGKGGIVRDHAAGERAVDQVIEVIAGLGFQPLGKTPSPITGADGNREWLVAATRP